MIFVRIEIANGDHPQKLVRFIDDGHVANAAVLHHAAGLVHGGTRLTAHQLRGHDVPDRQFPRIAPLGDDTLEASPGTWVHMSAGLKHSIQAKTPVVMLLLLLKEA